MPLCPSSCDPPLPPHCPFLLSPVQAALCQSLGDVGTPDLEHHRASGLSNKVKRGRKHPAQTSLWFPVCVRLRGTGEDWGGLAGALGAVRQPALKAGSCAPAPPSARGLECLGPSGKVMLDGDLAVMGMFCGAASRLPRALQWQGKMERGEMGVMEGDARGCGKSSTTRPASWNKGLIYAFEVPE